MDLQFYYFITASFFKFLSLIVFCFYARENLMNVFESHCRVADTSKLSGGSIKQSCSDLLHQAIKRFDLIMKNWEPAQPYQESNNSHIFVVVSGNSF